VNIYFEPQLTPVKGLKAEAGEDWIKLSWKACPDFTYQQDTITVAHYEVFLDQGGKWTSLGKVDKGSPSFTHSALSPGTGYKYSVQVANDILYMYEGVFHKLSSYSSSRLSAQTIQAATTASTTPASTDRQTV
jgi:hypothetical protein